MKKKFITMLYTALCCIVTAQQGADVMAADSLPRPLSMDSTSSTAHGPLILLDDREYNGKITDFMDVDHVDIYNSNQDVAKSYGDKGKYGVIKIYTKKQADAITYVINGKPASRSDFDMLNPSDIKEIMILTGGSAAAIKASPEGNTHDVYLITTNNRVHILSAEETRHLTRDLTEKAIYADSIFGGDYLKLRYRQGNSLSYEKLRSSNQVSLKESPVYVFDSLTYVNAAKHSKDRQLIEETIQSLHPTNEMVSCFLCYDHHALAHAVYKKRGSTWECIETLQPIDLLGDVFDRYLLNRSDLRVVMYPLYNPAWQSVRNTKQPWRGYIGYLATYNFVFQNQDGTLKAPKEIRQGNVFTETIVDMLYSKLNPKTMLLE